MTPLPPVIGDATPGPGTRATIVAARGVSSSREEAPPPILPEEDPPSSDTVPRDPGEKRGLGLIGVTAIVRSKA